MTTIKTSIGRRSFLKTTTLAGGGLILNFCWLASCQSVSEEDIRNPPKEWFDFNGYLKIGDNGQVTIMSPNPEGGQNVKTSMPMIVAEELDIDWKNVIVEQASLNTDLYSRQFIGGSNAIRTSWKGLRMAGATARKMLREAAAQTWKVSVDEITTEAGVLKHTSSGQSASYGEMAADAAKIPIPKEVSLKAPNDFKIIGTSKKNVDGKKIITGHPLFGIDKQKEGMLIAMIIHPPAFGMKLKSVKDARAKAMPGIQDVLQIKVLNDDFERQHFDTCTFLDVVAIVGNSTWEVMKAKKSVEVEWEPFDAYTEERTYYRQKKQTITIPAGLENTTDHLTKMLSQKGKTIRKDGNPEAAFKNAAKIIARTYTAPFLPHNCMEPMNFFADVKNGKAELAGPLQKAELTEQTISARLGIPVEAISIELTRLGGGYGRRSYAHWAVEAALISQKMNAPVKLIYSREDDMTGGVYRPAYQATYRAALDTDNKLIGIHINAGGIPESPLYANRFPAGAVDNYLAESWTVNTNITIGSFRAPRSNFIACAEQSFLDEVAEAIGKDPIDFRLELLENAKNNPIGERNDYDADRLAGVLKLVREKSNWNNKSSNKNRGVAAYYCHNSYAAQVLDLTIENGQAIVQNVCSVIDCGIVVNPDAAANLTEGAIVDGIGNALYGKLNFKNGVPDKQNFDKYRMIRMSEAPKKIEAHFVKSEISPTGLGEPAFPPVFGALANALYQATGKRLYNQPFTGNEGVIG